MKDVDENLIRQISALRKRVYRQNIEINILKEIRVHPQTHYTSGTSTANTPFSKTEQFVNDIADITQSDKERVKKKILENYVHVLENT